MPKRVSKIAALSHKEPWVIIHKDKVPGFPAFHINQEFILPSFCPNPINHKETQLHKLDDSPSKWTIARWLVETINQDYNLNHKQQLFWVTAHSTRAQNTSWAHTRKIYMGLTQYLHQVLPVTCFCFYTGRVWSQSFKLCTHWKILF